MQLKPLPVSTLLMLAKLDEGCVIQEHTSPIFKQYVVLYILHVKKCAGAMASNILIKYIKTVKKPLVTP